MKRLLIITYYWPPSGGSGVQRWLKTAKYLPTFGWQPVIYTPSNPDFNVLDKSLLSEVPEEAEIVKTPIWEPYQLYRKLFGKGNDSNDQSAGVVKGESSGWRAKIAKWVRGNLFVPDPRVFWRKSSVKYLENYLKENPVDVIISTGTPHSMHLIGLDLKEKFPDLPWFADFRDPWSELDMLKSYHIHPYVFKKYQALESKVLANCDLCLTTSKVWAEDFERLGAKNTAVMTNGFDEADFKYEVASYEGFVISHFGLLNHLRNPTILWSALNEVCSENEEFDQKLRIHLGGTIDPENLEDIYSYPNLKNKIKVFPYLSHEEVIKEYMKSSLLLLLLFNSDSGRGNIPGKLFEYMASRKPIIAFGRPGGDVEQLLAKLGHAKFFNYADSTKSDQLKLFISQVFKGQISIENSSISAHTRKGLTKGLVNLLEQN